MPSNIVKLAPAPTKSSEEVREILEEWLEACDEVEEIYIIGKLKSQRHKHTHSSLSNAVYWIGLLKYFSDQMSLFQMDGEG
jgi:calcineurin-like phosphoesterase family protein